MSKLNSSHRSIGGVPPSRRIFIETTGWRVSRRTGRGGRRERSLCDTARSLRRLVTAVMIGHAGSSARAAERQLPWQLREAYPQPQSEVGRDTEPPQGNQFIFFAMGEILQQGAGVDAKQVCFTGRAIAATPRVYYELTA